jgi:hypothetical protein
MKRVGTLLARLFIAALLLLALNVHVAVADGDGQPEDPGTSQLSQPEDPGFSD